MQRTVAMLLAFVLMISAVGMPAQAAENLDDPMAVKDYAAFGAPLEETQIPVREISLPDVLAPKMAPSDIRLSASVFAETLPVERLPEEKLPEETLPVETMPEETVPEETAPDETVPDETTESTEPTEENPYEPQGHNGVPLYFQNDYPDQWYGIGTVESHGCSAASLAMVATYMTGHEYLPDEIARYFGGAAENNIARLEKGSTAMKLAYKKAADWNETLEAVRNGKIAIVLVNAGSVFTNSQHFIIITGINEDGKLMVNDSWRPNYDKWDTKEGLKNGFLSSDIVAGWDGAWIYDKAAMPEEPFLYYEPEPVRGEPRYNVELTQAEKKLLAKIVWLEARGETEAGQQAVAEVILNRLVSDRFPDTLENVIYASGQFRTAKFVNKAKPYQLQYEIVENALYGPYILPTDVYYFATTPKTDKIWGQIGGHVFCYSNE